MQVTNNTKVTNNLQDYFTADKTVDGKKVNVEVYWDMFCMGSALSLLWEDIKLHRSSIITSPISRGVWELFRQIYPHRGACYSKLTALEAYEQFSSLLCK